jgi:hypothetical protein
MTRIWTPPCTIAAYIRAFRPRATVGPGVRTPVTYSNPPIRAYVFRMPRAIWSGSISFRRVNIPVKLFSAIASHRVAFHEFEEGTGPPVHHRRVSGNDGHEVPWKRIHNE